MKQVDSDALGVVNRALGLSGRGDDKTELLDGVLEQVVDVGPMIRRGRTLQPSEGIFYGVFENVHTIANVISSNINPYRPEVALAVAPFPPVVPTQFDIWLLHATVVRVAGGGTVDALLDMGLSGQSQAWGVDDQDVKVTQVPRIVIALWDNVFINNVTGAVLGTENQPLVKLGIRFPRVGTPDLVFRTISTEAATWQCRVVMGLFPVSMGQDAMVGGV